MNLRPGEWFIITFFSFFLLLFKKKNFDAHADMHIRPLTSAVLVAGRRCFSKNPSTPAGNPGAKAAKLLVASFTV